MRTLGIEREWFITKNGKITPAIGSLLPFLREQITDGFTEKNFGYELFAGQLEERTGICHGVDDLLTGLEKSALFCRRVASMLGLELMCCDYVTKEELGDLMVNPFDERHQRIWLEIDENKKVAASQVAAVHVHISASIDEAVSILNCCGREGITRLAAIGDFSQGKRLAAYRTMAGVYGDPPNFSTPNELSAYIKAKGGERDVWDLVRYKPSTGTVEFRMFGSTENMAHLRNMVIEVKKFVTSIVGL